MTASDWAKGLCSHRRCKDKRAAEVSRLGLKTGTGDKKQCVFAFVGAYGIFTSVKMDISRYISLIDIGDMWNLLL